MSGCPSPCLVVEELWGPCSSRRSELFPAQRSRAAAPPPYMVTPGPGQSQRKACWRHSSACNSGKAVNSSFMCLRSPCPPTNDTMCFWDPVEKGYKEACKGDSPILQVEKARDSEAVALWGIKPISPDSCALTIRLHALSPAHRDSSSLGLGNRCCLVLIPTLLLMCCVTLGKAFLCLGFPSGDNDSHLPDSVT